MKRRPIVLALLLSLGLNVGIIGTLLMKRSRAHRQAAFTAERQLPKLDRIADRLDLRGTQRLRFVEAQRRFLATVHRETRLLNRERMELRRTLTSPEPDRQRVEELVSSTGDRAEALDRAFAENVLFVREILDGAPEQRYIRFLGQMYARERGLRPVGR
jgi:Spy/CpxP family protein refolding chaperone